MKKNILILLIVSVITSFNVHAQSKNIDSLLAELPKSKEDTSKIHLLINISNTYITISPDDGIKMAEQALKLSEKLKWKKGIGHANLCLGSNYDTRSDYPKATEYYLKALKVYEELGDKRNIASVLCNVGLVCDAQSDYPKALEYLNKSLKIFQDCNEKLGMAKVNGGLAIVYDDLSDYPKALEFYFIALKLYEELDSKSQIAVTYANIGGLYHEQSNYHLSQEYYFKALKLFEDLGAKRRIATVLGNIGSNYGLLNDYNNSLEYLFKALKISKEVGSKYGIATILGNIANTYQQQKVYQKALDYSYMALEVNKEIEDKGGIASNFNVIGLVYFMIVKTKDNVVLKGITTGNANQTLITAKRYTDSAIAIQTEIGDLSNLSKSYLQLSDIEVLLGNDKGALDSYKNYSNIKDSVFNIEKDDKLTQIRLQFEFDKKQALLKAQKDSEIQKQKNLRNSFAAIGGIVLLASCISLIFYKRKRDAEQKQKETASTLRITETELKALRLQMNPHFIDNALQSIQYFLNEHKPDEAEEYLLKFSSLMRSVLVNSERDAIPLSKELETLEWYVELENLRMPHPFEYEVKFENDIDIENSHVPPNILQPFVENAIKHGLLPKSSSGHIKISISKQENDLHIIIEDDGVGRKTNRPVQEAVLLKRESLGIKITQERLNILNQNKEGLAFFKIVDLLNRNTPIGTRVELNLPF